MSLILVKYLKINVAHLKFMVYGCKQTSMYRYVYKHMCAIYPASVGLAQARPNYTYYIGVEL